MVESRISERSEKQEDASSRETFDRDEITVQSYNICAREDELKLLKEMTFERGSPAKRLYASPDRDSMSSLDRFLGSP